MVRSRISKGLERRACRCYAQSHLADVPDNGSHGASPTPLRPRRERGLLVRARLRGCDDGDRDRTRQEGPPRIRVRRHRDRALAAHARPRRHRHLLEARPLPVRAADARLGDGRRRLAARRPASSAASAAWRCSTSRASSPATRTPRSSSSGSPRCPRSSPRARCRRSTREPVKPELIAQRIARDQGAEGRRRRLADAAARAQATTRSRWRPGSTCS